MTLFELIGILLLIFFFSYGNYLLIMKELNFISVISFLIDIIILIVGIIMFLIWSTKIIIY